MPDFKKTAGAIASAAAGRARSFAGFAVRKTKNVSRIAKLNVDIAGERDTIKQAYSEIGKLYYETHRQDPEPYFAQLCQEIENAYESIATMEAEIVRIKTKAAPEEDGEAEDDTIPVIPPDEPYLGEDDPDKTV